MLQELTVRCVQGSELRHYIDDLAKLRIAIFQEYPYLYHGKIAYEIEYLKTYINSKESIMVLAFDQAAVVGASTAIPLEFETQEVQKPFREYEFPMQKIFYLGESVLLPQYRGHKIYRQFFQQREAAARKYGSRITAFCAVERALNDPRRPPHFQDLTQVWQHFGYTKNLKLKTYFEWQEIGEVEKSAKPMIFWLKTL